MKKPAGAKFANAILIKNFGVVLIVRNFQLSMIVKNSIVLQQKFSGLYSILIGDVESLLSDMKGTRFTLRI